MHYSRQYGGDGRYQKADLLIVGRPAVMAAGFALSAAVNHRRKVAARREAQVRWRDHQHVQVIATTDRLLCSTDQGLAERLVRERHRVLSRPAVLVGNPWFRTRRSATAAQRATGTHDLPVGCHLPPR